MTAALDRSRDASGTGPTDHGLVLAGDSALLVEFPDRIDPVVNARAVGLAKRVRTLRDIGLRDVIVTYRSVAICFDPLLVDLDGLIRDVESLVEVEVDDGIPSDPAIEIPVRYGGAFGPDLDEVARFGGCSPDEVVRLHAGSTYRVYMLGFVPGFAYMASVNERIAMPRRATPRVRVPAGSVGIAGSQTGIYPSDAPGGWRLIGRTDVRTFDLARNDPFLLHPGDRVRFVRVPEGASDRPAETSGA